ncbi:MAG: ROK family protein [bacterium]
MNLLGIDIGGTKTSVCIGDEHGRLLASKRIPTETPAGPGHWLPRTVAQVHDVLREAKLSLSDIRAVGIASPGPMSVSRGMMLAPPNMQGWVDVPVKKMVGDALGLPTHINNDANACAQAEFIFGSCKGTPNLVYLTMSTGIGAGIIVNGEVLQGVSDMGGEVGHHVLDSHGPPCPCGQRGCFEIYCGGLNVANRLRERIAREEARTAILDEAGGDPAKIDFRCLVAAVWKRDALALEAWDEYIERLAQGFGTIMMMVNPEVMILGTIAIHAGDLIIDPVRQRLHHYAWKHCTEPCRIIPSGLDTTIGDLSALAVAVCGMRKKSDQ